MKLWSYVLCAALVAVSLDADAARRLGGGKSVGRQSSNVTQSEAARAPAGGVGQPGAPSQAAAPARSAAPPAAAATPKRPWGAMLGGLAAGLGLAWLANSLGLGQGLANVMTMLLLAALVFLAVRWFMRSRTRGSEPAGAGSPGLALQGAGAGATGQVLTPKQYRPENVGNDASARPWESQQSTFDAVTQHQQRTSGGGIRIGSALQNDATWSIPADFDRAGFEAAAKRNFITLQNAWDRADISSLRAMMTDGMVHEIQQQLAERERESGGRINTTEVLALDARLLGIEELPDEYMASVEFTGTIKEDPAASPSPFREVWNMVKPRNGSAGWLVAGVQALQ